MILLDPVAAEEQPAKPADQKPDAAKPAQNKPKPPQPAEKPATPPILKLIQKLPVSKAKERDELFPKLIAEGPAGIKALCRSLKAPGKGNDTKVRYALHGLAVYVARNGAEKDRKTLSKTLAAELSGDLPPAVKGFIIRQLHHTGDLGAIKAISQHLLDGKNGGYAAQAILALGGPDAASALRSALVKAEGKTLITLIQAAGAIRDFDSVNLLVEHAASEDRDIRLTAFHALGEIGTESAIEVLEKAAAAESRFERARASAALLTAVERMMEAGKNEAAGKLYQKMFDGQVAKGEIHVRLAGLAGLGRAFGADALETVSAALIDENDQIRKMARRAAIEMKAEKVTTWLLEKLKTAEPAEESGILDILAARGDSGALPAALDALKHKNQEVRLAALNAVVALGNHETVPSLVQFLHSEQESERKTAKEALLRIPGKKTTAAIADQVGDHAAARATLIGLIASRGGREHLKLVQDTTQDKIESARLAAWNAIAILAAGDALPKLIQMHAMIGTDKDRQAAEKTILSVAGRVSDKEKASSVLLEALPNTAVPTRLSLLKMLGRIGHDRGLAAIREAVKDPDQQVAEAAFRALTEWTDMRAANDLLEIAGSSEQLVRQVLAIRSYVRLLSLPNTRPVKKSIKLYKKGLSASRRPEEKKLVIARLADLKSFESLELLRSMLEDDTLKQEATLALINIARGLSVSKPQKTRTFLGGMVKDSQDEHFNKQVNAVLDEIALVEDHITDWFVSKIYKRRGKKGIDLVDIRFPPEPPVQAKLAAKEGEEVLPKPAPSAAAKEGQPKPATPTEAKAGQLKPAPAKLAKPSKPKVVKKQKVNWQLVPGKTNNQKPWMVDLEKIQQGDRCAAYLKTFVRASEAAEASLQVGSDDFIKVWLNGKEVHSHNVKLRSLKPAEDKIAVKLIKGWNELLLKVVDEKENWEACARFRTAKGRHLENLHTFASEQGLNALLADLEIEELQDQAEPIALWIAERLIDKSKTTALFRKIRKTTRSKETRKLAAKSIEEFTKYEDYITTWEVSGPYTRSGKTGQEVFNVVFTPEDPNAKTVAWKKQPGKTDRSKYWYVDLMKSIRSNNAAGYLRTHVHSDKEQEVILQCGSDDGLKVFLNGKVVHANNALRSGGIGEDKVKMTLNEGWNVLLLKVSNNGGGWAANARFRTLEGGKLEGIRISVNPKK